VFNKEENTILNSKKNAVLLTEEPDRSVSDVAENLGIKVDLLYRRRRQLRDSGEIAFPGQGKIALTQEQKRMTGSPMITADMRDESGFATVSKNRVARHMCETFSPSEVSRTIKAFSEFLEEVNNRNCTSSFCCSLVMETFIMTTSCLNNSIIRKL